MPLTSSYGRRTRSRRRSSTPGPPANPWTPRQGEHGRCRRPRWRRAPGIRRHLAPAVRRVLAHRDPFLRRPSSTDRADAPRPGGRGTVARRAQVPGRAQLLHAAARPRGHATRHLLGVAASRRARRVGRRPPVRGPGRVGGARAGDALRGRGRPAAGGRAVPGDQGRGSGHRDRGPAEGGEPSTAFGRALDRRGLGLRGNLLSVGPVPRHYPGSRPGRISPAGRPKQRRGRGRARRRADVGYGADGGVVDGCVVGSGAAAGGRGRLRHPGATRQLLLPPRGGHLRRRLRGAGLPGTGRGDSSRLVDGR